MEKKEFNIGAKVIALTTSEHKTTQPREKGKVYIVNSVCYCSKCGRQNINVSGRLPESPKEVAVSCNTCGCKQPSMGLWWTSSNLFANVKNINKELEKAVADERYEDAQVIHNYIKENQPI
jgi:hypothetical protein